MKKRIFVLCIVAALAFSMLSVSAASGGAEVVQPRTAYGSFAIAAFGTKYLYDLNGQQFYYNNGRNMTVNLSLTTTASVGIGYIYNGQTVMDGTFTGKNISHTMTLPGGGSYIVVIQNQTAGGIYITSAEVL